MTSDWVIYTVMKLPVTYDRLGNMASDLEINKYDASNKCQMPVHNELTVVQTHTK